MPINAKVTTRQGRVSDTRELVVEGAPFIVIYRQIGSDQLQVIRVPHDAQQWPSANQYEALVLKLPIIQLKVNPLGCLTPIFSSDPKLGNTLGAMGTYLYKCGYNMCPCGSGLFCPLTG